MGFSLGDRVLVFGIISAGIDGDGEYRIDVGREEGVWVSANSIYAKAEFNHNWREVSTPPNKPGLYALKRSDSERPPVVAIYDVTCAGLRPIAGNRRLNIKSYTHWQQIAIPQMPETVPGLCMRCAHTEVCRFTNEVKGSCSHFLASA